MNLRDSRFAHQIETCTPGRCTVEVIHVLTGAGDKTVEVDPHAEGTILLRDTTAIRPYGMTTTTSQRFGRQSQLHRIHKCPATARKR